MTPDVLASIHAALAQIERDHGLRVLYAAESGSRAWGFASPDSDYDVRFIYAHPRDWYLGVFEARDTLDVMLPGDLDFAGWDVLKTLRLFARGNFSLNEWLDSPIVYRDDGAFAPALRALVERWFQPARALHHYLGTARSTHVAHLAGDTVRLKKVFYFLRPIFACRWIEHRRTQPPTAFAALLAAGHVTPDERAFVADFQARKVLASERDTEALAPAVRQWMDEQLAYYERIGPSLAERREADTADLDRLLRATLS